MSANTRAYFRELSQSAKDCTRLYWMLILDGPLSMRELRLRTNWTTHRTNDALYRLKTGGDVRLMERGQYVQPNSGMGSNRCGKWRAVTDQETVEAVEISA